MPRNKRERGTCTAEGCNRPHSARGLCQSHYDTWRHYGRTRLLTSEERFWAKVQKGAPDECWLWTASTIGKTGYGKIAWRGQIRGAHRVSYEIANGIEPDRDMVIRHTCDNPPCVNPAHLLAGTHLDNSLDMVTRGRSTAGERSSVATITWADVYRIRQLDAEGMPQTKIADLTGVNRPNVWAIIHRQSWKD